MGVSQRPIFDQTVEQAPPSPIFPTSVQATGMPTAPAPTAGFAAGLGAAANSMQDYRDVAIGKLARIHAMIDAGQLPQTALSDPSVQPLFHQAGLDIEGHLNLLPKPQDQITQLTSDELKLPQNATGTPNAATIAGLPSEQAGNVQGAGDVASRNPAVAKVLSKTPTDVQADNTLKAGDIGSETGVQDANTALVDAKTDYQTAVDSAERYAASGPGQDRVYRNMMQAAHAKLTSMVVELMKQQIAASQLSAADKKTQGDFLTALPARADAALTARHKDWLDTRQRYLENEQTSLINDERAPDIKQAEINAKMAEYDKKFPEPTLPMIMEQMVQGQAAFLGIPETALRPARANVVGFPNDAGTAQKQEVQTINAIEEQLKYSKTFRIPAPPGATTIDPTTKKRVPVPAGSEIEGTADMLLRSTDPWATPALKAHVRRFLQKGDPTLVNDPTKRGAGGSGRTPLNPGGLTSDAKPGTRGTP